MSKISLTTIEQKLYKTNEYGIKHQDPEAKLSPEEVEWLNKVYGINIDVHKTCINCQARYLIKHKIDNRKEDNHFKVPCGFIQNTLPAGSRQIIDKMMAEKGITRERATLVLRSTQDPVAWCELMLGFDDNTKGTADEQYLRAYQKEQIRCTSRRIVIRQGRRSGKTFAICCKLIHAIFNQLISRGTRDGKPYLTGPEIMIVTPYQAQVSNIFEEIEKLLKRSPDLMREVTTGTNGSLYVKTPFLRMEFANGAKISGFVSGVGTKTDGSGGGTMRGQNADVIYLDEMDLIPDDVLRSVILPIMGTRKGVRIIATSTPIGKRGPFHRWCVEDRTFKEDHLPADVAPQWGEVKDMAIAESTGDSFAAEFMAIFIEGGFGVFKPSLVYGARADYNYDYTSSDAYLKETLKVMRPERITRCIGIDWNKNAGTEFCVVGYDSDSNRWIVLESVNVPASEFSSIKWKEEVIRLNYKWKPQYIYADEGYGHTIIEDLKLLAHRVRSNPQPTLQHVETAKLVDRLIAFNFSSRVELRSPIDGTEIVKTGKDFLVENTIRILEDKKLVFSVEDDHLRKEMLNYVVLRRTPTTNKPIYGPENATIGDHKLDALMLALGGLYLQNSEYSPGQMAKGTPVFLSKEKLEARADNDGEQGASKALLLMQHLNKVPLAGPTALSLMEIDRMGGAGSPSSVIKRANRVERRPERSNEDPYPGDPSVYEHFKKVAKSNKGYETDEEHLNDRVVESTIGFRKQRQSVRSSRRAWLKER